MPSFLCIFGKEYLGALVPLSRHALGVRQGLGGILGRRMIGFRCSVDLRHAHAFLRHDLAFHFDQRGSHGLFAHERGRPFLRVSDTLNQGRAIELHVLALEILSDLVADCIAHLVGLRFQLHLVVRSPGAGTRKCRQHRGGYLFHPDIHVHGVHPCFVVSEGGCLSATPCPKQALSKSDPCLRSRSATVFRPVPRCRLYRLRSP